MMIRLITDSTSDLSPELREQYHIQVLPLCTILGGETYTDGVDITIEEIFSWSNKTKETPKTAVFSVQKAKDLFRSYLEQGDELICFAISEKMSASDQVMRLAISQLHAEDRAHVIDSANLSTGIGLMILTAAEMVERGASADEILRQIEATRPRVRTSFVVDTLTFLHRGGRCSGVAALAGNVLRLHPKIVVEDGAMRPERKYRGGMKRVLAEYTEDLVPAMLCAEPEHVFITHSGAQEELVDAVRQQIMGLNYFHHIHETRTGCVVASHCGPNTLGILFVAKEERDA